MSEEKIDLRKAQKPEINLPLPKPQKKESIFKNILRNRSVVLFLMGCCIVLLIAASAFLGAVYSCNRGGGDLINGFACVNVEVIGACNIGEKIYQAPESYYKELLPNGSLSTKNYTLTGAGFKEE